MLCSNNHFHDNDGRCVRCDDTNVLQSLAPIIGLGAACVLVVLFFQLQFTANFRRRVASWARQRRERIDWVLISMRLIFFDFQVLSKYSELQEIDWPEPFDTFMGWLSIIAFDLSAWFPSLECAPGNFNSYQSLLLWTVGPIALYTLACFAAVVRSGGHRPWKAMKKVTEVALQLLSLVHTLICVRIFQIFDCDKFDNGDDGDGKLFFLHADYSINCEAPRHRAFQTFSYGMIVFYAAVVPVAMLANKSRRHELTSSADVTSASGSSLLEAPFAPAFYWFDTMELMNRLSMTGLLLVVAPNSTKLRMMISTFLALAYLSLVTSTRPYLNESHNQINIVGKLIVVVTVTSGVFVETHTSHQTLIGSFLLVLNVSIVGVAVQVQRSERLHGLMDRLAAAPPARNSL